MARVKKKPARFVVAESKPKNAYKCDQPNCGKTFASTSNLNNHVRVKHIGICWICPVCELKQVSKHAHERHILQNHPEYLQPNMDLNCNQHHGDHVNRTEKAKDVLIAKLQKTVDEQLETILKLKNKLLDANKMLIELGRNEIALSDEDTQNEQGEMDDVEDTQQSEIDDVDEEYEHGEHIESEESSELEMVVHKDKKKSDSEDGAEIDIESI